MWGERKANLKCRNTSTEISILEYLQFLLTKDSTCAALMWWRWGARFYRHCHRVGQSIEEVQARKAHVNHSVNISGRRLAIQVSLSIFTSSWDYRSLPASYFRDVECLRRALITTYDSQKYLMMHSGGLYSVIIAGLMIRGLMFVRLLNEPTAVRVPLDGVCEKSYGRYFRRFMIVRWLVAFDFWFFGFKRRLVGRINCTGGYDTPF